MYFSAASRPVPVSARRYRSTSFTLGSQLSLSLNFGGNAVQITESIFLASAHSLSIGIESGDVRPLDQLPMYFSFGDPSRRCSCFFTSSRSIAVHKGP